MKNINVIFKEIRDAQGISQAELAGKLGITQSAITQFETNRSRLSLGTLLKIAPLLNINPGFIQDQTCNLFAQSNKTVPIKMYVKDDRYGNPDINILKLIVGNNDRCNIIYCGVNKLKDKRRNSNETFDISDNIFFICVQDSEDNIFLFRRKGKLPLKKAQLDKELKEIALTKKRCLFTAVIPTDTLLFNNADANSIRNLISAMPNRNNIEFIGRLINDLQRRNADDELENILRYAYEMNPDKLEYVLSRMVPHITNIVKEHFGCLQMAMAGFPLASFFCCLYIF
ncbi:MAG TPA: helix-turn-helix domain-containing protein [bacterium]|nr:helix-turn-helix domain-containing protein [bacterium]